MESIVKSDIFFFISSISVIIITVLFVIVGFYCVKIMKNFSEISKTLKSAVGTADAELREMGDHVRESPLFSFIFGRPKAKKRSPK